MDDMEEMENFFMERLMQQYPVESAQKEIKSLPQALILPFKKVTLKSKGRKNP